MRGKHNATVFGQPTKDPSQVGCGNKRHFGEFLPKQIKYSSKCVINAISDQYVYKILTAQQQTGTHSVEEGLSLPRWSGCRTGGNGAASFQGRGAVRARAMGRDRGKTRPSHRGARPPRPSTAPGAERKAGPHSHLYTGRCDHSKRLNLKSEMTRR